MNWALRYLIKSAMQKRADPPGASPATSKALPVPTVVEDPTGAMSGAAKNPFGNEPPASLYLSSKPVTPPKAVPQDTVVAALRRKARTATGTQRAQ